MQLKRLNKKIKKINREEKHPEKRQLTVLNMIIIYKVVCILLEDHIINKEANLEIIQSV